MSVPLKAAINSGIISVGTTVHDYGCGQGEDVDKLLRKGIAATGHDIAKSATQEKKQADVIMLTYVINTIEDKAERAAVLKDAYDLANEYLVVSARTDRMTLKNAKPWGDGLISDAKTFQKFYTTNELKSYVSDVLDAPAVKLSHNTVYVKKKTWR
jgi:DNA phosphorothioation-associated putative methyltransferase